jgi:hypothetical protein
MRAAKGLAEAWTKSLENVNKVFGWLANDFGSSRCQSRKAYIQEASVGGKPGTMLKVKSCR